jgi:hypothetical protein
MYVRPFAPALLCLMRGCGMHCSAPPLLSALPLAVDPHFIFKTPADVAPLAAGQIGVS